MNFSAVLLSGGESRRMGRDKATIAWSGGPLWQSQLATLRALQPTTIFLSAREEKPWRPVDVKLVIDADESRGPMAGIAATLRACETTHLVVLAIDLPLMTSAYLREMLARTAPGRGVVPRIGDRFESVCAIYPRESLSAFERGAASLQVLVAKLISNGYMEPREVSPSDYELFKNVNEPADLAASSVARS